MKATGRIIGSDSGKVGTHTRRIQPRRCDNGKPAELNPGGVLTSRKAVKPAESTQDRPRTHHRNQKGSTEDQPQQSKGIRRRSISQPQGPEGLALLHTVGPVPRPPSPRPRQAACIERVQGIPRLIRPSSGGGSGGGHSSSGGGACTSCCAPHTSVSPCGGFSGPSVAEEAVGGGSGGSSPPPGGRGPSFRHPRGPAQTLGEDDLQHTCGCPLCVVHYETCIQSLMA